MSNEECEKKVEFIVEQQAHLAARMAQFVDIVSRFAKETLDRFENTDKRIDDVDERISRLVDSQMSTEGNMKKTAEIVRETTENIRNLTAVVGRYFSEGRNGKSGS